ncbi:MAG: hypothetical protein ACE14L_05235 [Terriglobales bacterium]
MRDDGLKDPNPYLMSLEHVGQTSSQAKQYLLCPDCEQRFSRNGENPVINHCYHGDNGSFRLRDLKTATPILSGHSGGAYDASQIPGVDIEKIVYFSASVIWRASLRQWRIQKQTYEPIQIHAKHREELRQYLLGTASFPQNAASVVHVSTSDVPPLTAGFPDSLHDVNIDMHRFYIPGIWFHVVLGKGLTSDHRQMCILRSPVHPICLDVMGDALVHAIGFNLYWSSKTGRF